jgi:UDP-glucose 4-epimerase
MCKVILITGVAGYIGSHMVRTLMKEKYTPVVFDNLSTGHREFVPKDIPFIKGDLRKDEMDPKNWTRGIGAF